MGFLRRLFPETKVEHDPALDLFDGGCWVLSLEDGKIVGHVASTISWFRTPFQPFTKQDWIWLLLVWSDGKREMPIEDYPPWSSVRELRQGEFVWGRTTYTARRLPADEAKRAWADLGITNEDF